MPTDERRRRETLLDEMLADSFPASDAPSFTPVTGTGGPESDEHAHQPVADADRAPQSNPAATRSAQ
jgi:hypothetical protein